MWKYIDTSYSYTSAVSKQYISYIEIELKQLLNVHITNFLFLLDGSVVGSMGRESPVFPFSSCVFKYSLFPK